MEERRPPEQKAEQHESEWLDKNQAAKRLNLSVRRVLEFASQGIIPAVRVQDPRSHQRIVVFRRADVDRYIEDRQKIKVDAGPKIVVTPRPEAKRIDLRTLFSEARDDHGRLWLTLSEAETYTGLPASFLEKLVLSGRLAALDVGDPIDRWRLRRIDLDAIEWEHQLTEDQRHGMRERTRATEKSKRLAFPQDGAGE